MTAEIAIMNKEAIALASDSAVTMTGKTGEKIFTSANKLFTLSKYHPVGIMIYGSAIFMGVPWETIIKIYRKTLGKKKFGILEEYANHFLRFLDDGNPLFPDSIQEDYLRDTVYSYFQFITEKIKERVRLVIDQKAEITEQDIGQIASEVIKEHYEKWERADIAQSISRTFRRTVIKKYGEIIDQAIKDIFEKIPLSKLSLNRLKKIAGNLFSKFSEEIEKSDISGIVIAGFGEEDTFPSLVSFHVEGILNNKLKYKKYVQAKIDFNTHAVVIPFAQREMVYTFMEGVDPHYVEIEQTYLSEVFKRYAEIIVNSIKGYTDGEKIELKQKLQVASEQILKDFTEKLTYYRQAKYVSPITKIVSMLPKDELAAMAESLVSLTSLKRKYTLETETVGGPIDVAVISKGDGFIWIKRKHYFKAELNPQFFQNYFREI